MPQGGVPGQGRAMPQQKEKEIVEPGRLEMGSFVWGARGGQTEPQLPNWRAPDPGDTARTTHY